MIPHRHLYKFPDKLPYIGFSHRLRHEPVCPLNLYYTSSKNEHDFKKCITILKPSEKKKAWDNRGIYRSSFFVENGIYYIYYSGIGYPKGPNSSQGVGLTYGPSVKNIHGYDA